MPVPPKIARRIRERGEPSNFATKIITNKKGAKRYLHLLVFKRRGPRGGHTIGYVERKAPARYRRTFHTVGPRRLRAKRRRKRGA